RGEPAVACARRRRRGSTRACSGIQTETLRRDHLRVLALLRSQRRPKASGMDRVPLCGDVVQRCSHWLCANSLVTTTPCRPMPCPGEIAWVARFNHADTELMRLTPFAC